VENLILQAIGQVVWLVRRLAADGFHHLRRHEGQAQADREL
jgi:hypothetical protein